MPDKQGYAEIVKKAVEGQAEQIQLLVYFLDLDLKPLASPPSAATFKPTDRAVKELDLKASGDPDQSIASPPFSDPGELEGRLSTTINGKPITLSIRVR